MSDLISRQAAIDAVKKNTFRLTFAEEQNCEGHLAWSANAVYSDVIEGALLELPSAQPETHDERTETHACDCISRQAAIDYFVTNVGFHDEDGYPIEDSDELRKIWTEYFDGIPSAQPERKRGKWIYSEDEYGVDGYHCDKCGFFVPWDYVHKFINYIEDYNFCPNCGADMRGEQDG
jgi:hypothetical protein